MWNAVIGASPLPRASIVTGPGAIVVPGEGAGSRIHGFRPATTVVGVAAGCGVGEGSTLATSVGDRDRLTGLGVSIGTIVVDTATTG